MEQLSAISSLKLRASYGEVGNASVDAYATMGTLIQDPSVPHIIMAMKRPFTMVLFWVHPRMQD
jgi:hypothetical protein